MYKIKKKLVEKKDRRRNVKKEEVNGKRNAG